MSRFPFGGSIADWTFGTVDGVDEVDNLAQVVGGIPVTFWSAEVGGVPYTDLLTADGAATTAITSADGDVVGGRATGQIPPFFGPDAVPRMWAQAGTGPRALMVTTAPDGDDLGMILPPLSVPGTAAAPAIGRARLYNDTGVTLSIAALRASVGTPPTTAVVVDLNRNGQSIFTDPADRPVIAVGAYTSAILTVVTGWSFWPALIVAGLLSAVVSTVLTAPVWRLRGHYVAIATLGIGSVAVAVIRNW